MDHHDRLVLSETARRVQDEFRRISADAVQHVNGEIAASGLTLRSEERSCLIYKYIIEHTTEQAVVGHYSTMLSQLNAKVRNSLQQQASYREFLQSFVDNIPPDNPLHIQGEQAIAEAKAKEASILLCKDQDLKNYMELGKEGSAFIDQKVAAGDIRPLTSDEHTKLINQYIEYRADVPAVKTYAETMEASLDAKIEYDSHEAERYIAYKKHHEQHKHQSSYLYNLFKVVAIGAVAVFAPPLVATIAPMLASLGTAGTLVGTGVACAGTDALIQEIGIATGQQKSFSVNEVLETGVSVGLGSAAASAGMIPAAMTSAAGGAVTQAVECQMGTRDDLDPLAVVAQGASSIVSTVASQVVTPCVSEALQENFPDVVKKVGEENVALAANGVTHATANSAVQSIALNTPMSLECFLVNALGSTLGAKVGAAINDVLYKLNTSGRAESNLREPPDTPTEDNVPNGAMCFINETSKVQLPPEQEMQEFYEMIKQTIVRISIVSTATTPASNETSTTPTNPEVQADDLMLDAHSDDIEAIPPVIVNASETAPPAYKESFYGSLSGWQKVGLSIGIVVPLWRFYLKKQARRCYLGWVVLEWR